MGYTTEERARKSGSIVLASEPGVGVTLTSWGDASPSIGRFFGRCAGNGFEFREGRKVGGRARLRVTITFETDDRWIAEIREGLGAEAPIASYTFTRAVASR